MTKETAAPPDFDALAKKYLDLWQEQIGKLAKDPGKMSDAATAWSEMASSFMKGAPASTPFTASSHDPASAAYRPTPAAPSHGAGGLDPVELLGRLDAIERRLAALESKPARKAPGPAGRGRSSGPKP